MTLSPDGEHVQSITSADTHPDATFPELVALAVDYLKAVASTGVVSGAALVTPMESGDKLGFAVQLQSRSASFFYLFPYRATQTGWVVDEPERGAALLIPEGFF